MLLFFKNSLHIVWCFSCLSWARYLQTEWAHGWGSLWQFPMLRTDWLPVTARDLHLALSLLTAAVPMMVGGGGTVRLVTLIVWWHSPYWVMINYPISWTGFHNRLLIVSSSTPGIVIEDWAIIEIPFRWHPQCHKERLGTICPHDILRLTYLISIKRFEAGWLSFNGRTVPDNTDKSH